MSELQTLVANINGLLRTVEQGGRPYLVAPVVMLVEGVLNNEYVSAQEISKFAGAWNGRPFVLDHPRSADGIPISANDPAILSQYAIGQVFNARFDDAKLKAEVWIDQQRAKSTPDGIALLNKLERDEMIEISTAYWRDSEPTAGVFANQGYKSVARNLRPDHLAALLNKKGSCSIDDGCGCPRLNEEGDVQANVRTPSYEGTENTAWGNVSKSFAAFRDGYYRHTGAARPDEPINRVADAPQQMKNWIAARTLNGQANADTEAELISYPVVNPSTNRLNRGGLAAAAQRASQMGLKEVQSKASSLLESKFRTNTVFDALSTVAGALGINLRKQEELQVNKDQALATLCNRLRINGDDDERRRRFAALSAEDIELFLNALPQEQDEKPEETEPEPETNEEMPVVNETPPCPEPPAANELPESLVTLAAELEKRGGVDALLRRLDEVQANEEQRKTELVSAVAANARCAFTKEQLDVLDLSVLEGLHNSLAPVDYSGRGFRAHGLSQGVEGVGYQMPDISTPAKEQ